MIRSDSEYKPQNGEWSTIKCHCVICGRKIKISESYYIKYGSICRDCYQKED